MLFHPSVRQVNEQFKLRVNDVDSRPFSVSLDALFTQFILLRPHKSVNFMFFSTLLKPSSQSLALMLAMPFRALSA